MNLETKTKRVPTVLVIAAIIVCLSLGGLVGYTITYSVLSGRINDLQNRLSTLPDQNVTYIMGTNTSLSQLYDQVKGSVVIVRGQEPQYDIFHRLLYYAEVQGSGFVYDFSGRLVVVTNYHVVQGTVNITVTFIDGNAYPTTVLGSDPYEDLAVLWVDAPQGEFKPLSIVSSSILEVGDPVVAVGTPYGLAGSMTIGIVSALGRTITEDMTGGYPIASVIQTSTPINPGNSGGPLLNYLGKVVGITTAIVSGSQGLGFAIPSSAILREIEPLVTKGSYDQHPSLGATGIDMTYEIGRAMGVNVTYGWLIVQVASGGPANMANLQGGTQRVVIAGATVTIGGDIITAINNTRITSMDDLSTFLEENTLPNQTVNVTIVRIDQTITVPVTLGARPPPV
jgi:S1-C subfamily serine protease